MLSIILTVYNKETYLIRALDGLLCQEGVSQSDYEVIALNDGSTDNSLRILEDYDAQFPNFRVVTQNNQGLSMARNNRVDAAKGDYIWFVDADDMIPKNAVFC